MKILQIVPSYKPAYVYGGPIESVAKLCEGLMAAGHQVDVYTTTANGTTELEVAPGKPVLVDGVPITYFTRITKDHTHLSPALWRQLYRNCRHYDIVHIQSWWSPLVIVAAFICQARHVKVMVSPRGMLSDYIFTATNKKAKQLIHWFGGKKALRDSSFHATSQAEFDECKTLLPLWRGFMIPNILSLPDLPLIKTPNDRFTLLFLSRIHPKKGLEFLLEAVAKASQNLVLKIAGDGEAMYIDELKQKVKDLDIADKIEWIGWKDKAEKFTELMRADLFVLTSRNENFANVVIESLHAGTPVLVSQQVGLATFVEREKLGWVTSLQPDDIAAKLDAIVDEQEQLQWIRQHSRRVIQEQFSEAELIRQYTDAYDKVAGI